jgi:SanA protein
MEVISLVKKIIKRCFFIGISVFIIMTMTLCFLYYYVGNVGSKYLLAPKSVPQVDAIIVLGAYVFPNGQVSQMLADRLDYGYKLYQQKKAPKIIVSGDHGSTTYDEVNNMRKYLQAKGVPREDIFMDHAGFNTYDSMYRMRDIFTVKKAVIVSQEYHVVRAVYIAKKLGLEAYGVASDPQVYAGMKYYLLRELGSRTKAFMQASILKPKPKYLGDTIPIWKSGVLTDDGKS